VRHVAMDARSDYIAGVGRGEVLYRFYDNLQYVSNLFT
jgi:hypothetical protein